MLAIKVIQCLMLCMTSTPEQPNTEAVSVSLNERLLRIRNAIIELELAHYSVGLQPYYQDEIAANYVDMHFAERASRAVLDETDQDGVSPIGVIPEYVQKRAEWVSNRDMKKFLSSWLEPQLLDQIDRQYLGGKKQE